MSLLLALTSSGGITSGTLNSAGTGAVTFVGVSVFKGELLSAGVAGSSLNSVSVFAGALNAAGVASDSLNAVAVSAGTLNTAGAATDTLVGVALFSGILNAAGLATDSLIGEDAGSGSTIVVGELNAAGAGVLTFAGVDANAAIAEPIYIGMVRRRKYPAIKAKRVGGILRAHGESEAQFGSQVFVEAKLSANGGAVCKFDSTYSHVIELPKRHRLPREVAMLLLAA